MKRYFKHDAESDLGVGMAYMEITDGWPSRQVEVYGEIWRYGDEAHPEHLADQPLEFLGLCADDEISAAQFEHAWEQAMLGGGYANADLVKSVHRRNTARHHLALKFYRTSFRSGAGCTCASSGKGSPAK